MVPEGWRLSTLGSLLSSPLKNGYSPIAPEQPTGIWVLALNALTGSGFDGAAVKAAPDNGEVQRAMLQKGDFLISRANTPERVGYSAMFRDEVENCSYPDLMMRFRPDETIAYPEYLEQKLWSQPVKSQLRSAAAGTSKSMVKLNKAAIEKTKLLLPPLPEQKKIAEILGTWDRAIEVAEKQLKNAEAQKRALMQHLLTGTHRLKGFEGSEWKTVKLGDVCDILVGHPFNSSGFSESGVKLVRGSNVKRGRLDWSQNITRCWSDTKGFERYLIEKDDILIAMDGALVGSSHAFVDCVQDNPMLLVQRVARLRAKPNACPSFLYALIESPQFQKHVEATKTVTAIPHISNKDIQNYHVLNPSADEQLQIGDAFKNARLQILILTGKLNHLRTEKRALMQQLLTGKKRVKVEEAA
ncbi:type I restriction-modification enzyme subunit S HsdS [Pseudovibrio sp. FO-BEG1]|uniref:restriction endonuclease subunit S n=1 Tax=Pseudovibrio sp. (strain FO-BEG1) TaxID=911045 RepID=UPI000238D4C3|nr:restriction endonuclease subunit S [Pseudovibrio sp. FO-BEG1]AEV35250.1 type I restriction-modification enzyme subunit S HsdS [Pseudovibrio sp. FO-BEG1]